MQEAVQAYSSTAKITESPRDREASLLLKAAAELQRLTDDWENSQKDLEQALYYNRRLWTIFVSSVADKDNPLPIEIKNNIASLGAFIFHHTITVQRQPAPEKLNPLITINREIAAGLRTNVAEA